MNIGVLIIGDEILSGRRQDAHFARAIEILHRRQLNLDWARLVGDDAPLLVQQFREIRASGDLCFSFGGIGATPDDVTRQSIATVWEVPLTRHPEAQAGIEEQFGESAYPNRILMADLPRGADLIPNPVNRIPGFGLGDVHCLPGFPRMAWPMMEWVLDTHYAHLVRTERSELAVTVRDVYESDLLETMNVLLSRHPEVKLFSLPRFLEGGACEVEIGVKGRSDVVTPALEEIKALLDAKGCSYSEPSGGTH